MRQFGHNSVLFMKNVLTCNGCQELETGREGTVLPTKRKQQEETLQSANTEGAAKRTKRVVITACDARKKRHAEDMYYVLRELREVMICVRIFWEKRQSAEHVKRDGCAALCEWTQTLDYAWNFWCT